MMVLGILFIMFLSVAAWKSKTLTKSGMIGAMIVGSAIYVGFSWKGILLLGCFFVTSNMWGKIKSKQKDSLHDMVKKHNERDIIQVFANGGVPAFIAMISIFDPSNFIIYTVLFSISLAAANSDTWASEIGTLSKGQPRMLLTCRKVERGTSGAVSLLGTCAALVGSCLIGAIAVLLFDLSIKNLLVICIFGFLGNIIDTILGQTVQVKYTCRVCHKVTEKNIHCQQLGRKTSTLSFLDNDAVNVLSIVFSTCLSLLIL
ncbi:DUF92 domain-containing protein [Metabacillus halosaccharovorans]|uniref:DUF92 domain-containing protein n=1 Tax=Metabacillus halosaccharovorans TaxID=930124 RepID=UPI003736F02C